MSIRGFLAASLAVVGVIITVMAGLLISDRWQTTHDAAQARELVDALAAGTVISEWLAPERGATGVAIAAGDDLARNTMLEARAKTNVALAEAQRTMAAATFSGQGEVVDDIAKLASDLAALRTRADSLILRGRAEQTTEASQAIVEGVSALIERAVRLTNLLEQRLSGLDAEVARPAAIAQVAWSLRDNAGRQSILFLQAINSHKAATPDIRRRMDMAEGAIDQIWRRLTVVDRSRATGVIRARDRGCFWA